MTSYQIESCTRTNLLSHAQSKSRDRKFYEARVRTRVRAILRWQNPLKIFLRVPYKFDPGMEISWPRSKTLGYKQAH